MDVVFVVGRVLLVLVAIFSGLTFHFSRAAVEAARQTGSPAPELTAPLSGIALVVGGLMVALGLWADLGALLVLAAVIPITYYAHSFWKLEGAEREQQVAHFFKNVAVIGGLVVVFWLYNQGQDVDASLTDALFSRW